MLVNLLAFSEFPTSRTEVHYLQADTLTLHTSTSTSKRHNQQHSSNAAIIIGFVITTISWFAQGGASELQNKIIKSRKRTPTALRHHHHLSTTINKHFQRSNNIICSIEIESDGLRKDIRQYQPRPFCSSWNKKRGRDIICCYCITPITCINCTSRKMVRLPFYTM